MFVSNFNIVSFSFQDATIDMIYMFYKFVLHLHLQTMVMSLPSSTNNDKLRQMRRNGVISKFLSVYVHEKQVNCYAAIDFPPYPLCLIVFSFSLFNHVFWMENSYDVST
jgi:hypothetical protein